MRGTVRALPILLLVAGGTGCAMPETAADATGIDPSLQAAVTELRPRTGVPIAVPRRLPDVGQGSEPIYATVVEASTDGYRIVLGFTPDCGGGTACRLGELAARRAAATAPPGQPVELAGGLQGRFVDATCGANCSDSTLTWQARGVERSVGLKAGSVADVTGLANAVIDGAVVEGGL